MEALKEGARDFLSAFIPLFVVIDAAGNLPVFLTLTREMEARRRVRVLRYALLTSLGLGLGFMAVGKGIFLLLGIQVADFMVAGGLILLLFAAKDLIIGKMIETPAESERELSGVVPLGTPLLVGPAALATLIILMDNYHLGFVIVSFILNLAIVALVFSQADRISRLLGKGGLSAISKVMSVLLAAIGVGMVIRGLNELIRG